MPRGKPKIKSNGPDRKPLLDEFGVITLEGLATLWGVDIKTLQNKATRNELPRHSRVGGKRLFFKEDVLAYMRKHMA
jgi:Helix-turn-helix domain